MSKSREADLSFTNTYEGIHSTLESLAEIERYKRGFNYIVNASWVPNVPMPTMGKTLVWSEHHGMEKALFDLDDALVSVVIYGPSMDLRIAAANKERVQSLKSELRSRYPDQLRGTNTISVRFWTNSPRGPVQRPREVLAQNWTEIARNYPGALRFRLADLMGNYKPDAEGGKLHLWHGPAGTGKTHALRSLAREWSSWAEMHYIIDPVRFFQGDADYLLEVVLSEQDPDYQDRWRLIVCEDAGELLSLDAKSSVGQGLTRFLNLCDGIVGQGLRIQLLVTTNEDIGKFHSAVTRPGRIAKNFEFGPFSREEGKDWLGEEVEERHTLAELYALRRGESLETRTISPGFSFV